jgi:hypothetical protein
MSLEQFSKVRVRQLFRPPDEYDGWRFNQRPPRIGDTGFIVDILHAPGVPDDFVVECGGPDGITVWLGDFSADEIEAVDG